MRKQGFSRFTLAGGLLALAMLVAITLFTSRASGQEEQESRSRPDNQISSFWRSPRLPLVSVSPLLTFSDHTPVFGGGSQLVRKHDGVYMSLHAPGLTPGTVVTSWWVFFNNPNACRTSPCSVDDLFNNPDAAGSLVLATGRMVGMDGTADYGAFIGVGDATGAVRGAGLTNPLRAEIHLVTRTHGPALLNDPARFREQLTSFNGGCPPNTCGNLQVSIHQP
jgi:hypothetical protein